MTPPPWAQVAALPSPTEGQALRDVSLDAAGLANFSVFAPGEFR